MDGKQKIHCTVGKCQYNDAVTDRCTLAAIEVTKSDEMQQDNETTCSSFESDEY